MSTHATLSRLPLRRFWGWGAAGDELSAMEQGIIMALISRVGGSPTSLAPPVESDFTLRSPRIRPPDSLAEKFSDRPLDRLNHSYGKSYADCARMWLRQVPNPPDWVAFPADEKDVVDILDWAARHNVAVVPYGGGSSVCGGVEPDVGNSYSAVVMLDMERLDRVLEVDAGSRAARIQAGVYGPALEDQLRVHNLTLRFFPQSFQFSTLGGWIATRAGGHYASLHTHIDDLIEATRTVTPAGVIETRRLPGSGAGPAPDRLILGSEGSLGVITEAWVRLQDRPKFRASASLSFDDMRSAVLCLRALAQSGLYPSNCRLLDSDEVAFTGVGDGQRPMIVLGFESADHPLHAWMARALELAEDHGASYDAAAVQRSMAEQGDDTPEHRKGDAGAWRNAFIRMPYWRDPMIGGGGIIDTFESAITWDRFDDFYRGVKQDVQQALRAATGRNASVSCRVTHVYPDGLAPYFSFGTPGPAEGDIASALACWRDIKQICNATVVRQGGTITHHHAIGRDHRSGYATEVPALYRQALAGIKKHLDPSGIMNPGVLMDPPDRMVGITGALRGT